KRVSAIRQKREAHFIQRRQMRAIEIEREMDRKEVKRDISLIRSAAAGQRQKKPRKSRVVVMKDVEEDEDQLLEDEEMRDEMESDDDDDEMIQDLSDEEAEALLNES